MDKQDKDKPEPSFPVPYDHFNEVLALDIQELRKSQKEYELSKSEFAKANENLKNISPHHHDYRNKELTVLYHQKNEKILEEKVSYYHARTYGVLERALEENEAEPDLKQEVMQVLDEKLYPEKYDNKSPNEEKLVNHSKKETADKDQQLKTFSAYSENRKDMKVEQEKESSSSKEDYSLTLIQQKKAEKEQQKADIREKSADNEKSIEPKKESIPDSGYLNYQLKYQKPVYLEKSAEDKTRDTSKERKDIAMDKD